ncbi:uncharacterized protein MELLADRAFT_107650 [Melampsora larici-populina 98AG31]|uniref:Uncharacterized protein n=1 Tax=Melampsora larici-populina (strain 98AG31 / pathotype 3-4-7) TaxID=747676 RepID=F4RQB4_MELLP|nr:uncharacterized protein MELLADRAFT_107650 [Melampsora larici-populina 98AG31]EGG05434.1 hypothetical protein MELLADRAFT_107650 [Melampsora larici-populina 98AG31]
MVQRVAVRCGIAGEKAEPKAVWAATDLPTRACIAYLRQEAARLVLKGCQGCKSIWAAVDKQLSQLRLRRDKDYTTAFYQIIYDKDKVLFPGEVWFKTLKARKPKVKLDMPSDEAIMAQIPRGAGNGGTPPSNLNPQPN